MKNPNNLCEGVKVIKRKNKTLKKIGALLLITTMFFGVIFVATNSAGVLTVGNFSLSSLFKKQTIIKGQNLYAVTLGELDNEKEAASLASSSSMLGASGFVWLEGEKYFVIGSIYTTKEEAMSVQTNLGTEYLTTIKEIVFEEIKLPQDEHNSFLKESINYLYNLNKELALHAKELEKKQTTQVAVASVINTYSNDIKVMLAKIDYAQSGVNIDSLNKLKTTLSEVEAVLSSTVVSVLSNNAFAVKYCLAKIAFNTQQFSKSFN